MGRPAVLTAGTITYAWPGINLALLPPLPALASFNAVLLLSMVDAIGGISMVKRSVRRLLLGQLLSSHGLALIVVAAMLS